MFTVSEEFPEWIKNAAQDLWGAGFTIAPRVTGAELYDAATPPRGMSYQWHNSREVTGWSPVPYRRHEGIFAPAGTLGDIELDGQFLLERSAAEVEAFHAASHRKAHKNVEDWIKKQGAAGMSGSVTVGGTKLTVGDGLDEPFQVRVPSDMFDHLSEILRERDRMVAAAIKASIEVPRLSDIHMASLKASCLRIAIDVIRQKYRKGDDDGTRAERDGATAQPAADGGSDGSADAAEAPTGTPEEGSAD